MTGLTVPRVRLTGRIARGHGPDWWFCQDRRVRWLWFRARTCTSGMANMAKPTGPWLGQYWYRARPVQDQASTGPGQYLTGFDGICPDLTVFVRIWRYSTGFDRIWLYFTVFYRVSPYFTEFLPCFTEFYRVFPCISEYFRVLPSITVYYRV